MTSRRVTGPTRPTSIRKRGSVLAAAETAFLAAGYDGVTVDAIAEVAGVSKQTVYSHFGSKEGLFLELVTSMTVGAGDLVRAERPLDDTTDVESALVELMGRQLEVVLEPRLLRLRRLVIGEAARFPALARALAEHGPQRAVAALTVQLTSLDARGVLSVPDPRSAASQLNWLVMGEPVNDAMLLGDDAVPSAAGRDAHVRRAVATFLAAYRAPADGA